MQHVFFLHIPKTGGTSIESVIRAQDPARVVCPANRVRFIRELDLAKTESCEYFFSHSSLSAREILPHPLFVFTFLRDPVDRIVSAYNHLLRDDTAPGYQAVVDERLDIVSALGHHATSGHLTELATRMLGSDIDLRRAYPDQEAMQLAENLSLRTAADEFTYRRALRRLGELDFVGFSENFDADLRHLAAMLGLRVDRVPFENRERNHGLPLLKAVRSPDVEQAVRKLSPFDCMLYEEAREVFWRAGQHSRVPDETTWGELTRRAPLRQTCPPDAVSTRQANPGRIAPFVPAMSMYAAMQSQVDTLTVKLDELHQRAAAEIAARDRTLTEITRYAQTIEAELRGVHERAATEIAARDRSLADMAQHAHALEAALREHEQMALREQREQTAPEANVFQRIRGIASRWLAGARARLRWLSGRSVDRS